MVSAQAASPFLSFPLCRFSWVLRLRGFLGGSPSRWLLFSRGLPVTSAPRRWWGGSDRPRVGGPRGVDPTHSPPSYRAELLSPTCPPVSPSAPRSYQVIPFSCPRGSGLLGLGRIFDPWGEEIGRGGCRGSVPLTGEFDWRNTETVVDPLLRPSPRPPTWTSAGGG